MSDGDSSISDHPIVVMCDSVARPLAFLGSAGLLSMMLHVSADVGSRLMFGGPLPATVEIVSRYYMVLIAFLPLAWVERHDEMISVDLLHQVLPPSWKRLSSQVVSSVVASVYLSLAWTTWKTALSNYATASFVVALNYKIPVWPSYFLVPIGFTLAAVTCAVHAIRPGAANDASAIEQHASENRT
ncbi:MAG: TRAP transporter small permease [Mesorhizobium sp.]|uniref:TRAP transporter small permease n=1 Tax=Mesorhizobium sp. TaxID=1871066 RepID=UPI000FE8662B|nr:TRAP transporter small permease [Mesorhizobium sp.]RWI57101.1 MAG: TRAP transporter small permease [Mesorhizobium sp.]